MPFPDLPAQRTFDRFPDDAALGLPLRVPNAMTTPPSVEQSDGRIALTWRIPWGWVVATFAMSFGSMTGGVAWALRTGRVGEVAGWSLLSVIWGTLFPFALWVFHRMLRHAIKHPRLLEVEAATSSVHIDSIDGGIFESSFEDVRALVQVTRMIPVGEGGGRWVRRSEFSLLFGPQAGPWTQVALLSLRETGGREARIRSCLYAVPRMVGCEVTRVAIDRHGDPRQRSDR